MITWTKALEVGHVEIDNQHKKLFHLANRIERMVQENNFDNKILQKRILELRQYTEYHFSWEESFMEDNNFSSIEDHKEEHLICINAISEMLQQYSNPTISVEELSKEIYTYLTYWLREHVLRRDREVFKDKFIAINATE